jgi:uncharacterized protein YegP (UPF0339 family)
MSDNLIYVTVYKSTGPRYRTSARRQPWRWRATSGSNHRILASGEGFANEADCVASVQLLFGDKSNVYLRQAEQGDQVLRMAVPL